MTLLSGRQCFAYDIDTRLVHGNMCQITLQMIACAGVVPKRLFEALACANNPLLSILQPVRDLALYYCH